MHKKRKQTLQTRGAKLTLQLTISDSSDDHSNKKIVKINPRSDPLVDNHTSDGMKEKITDPDTIKENYAHKLLTKKNPSDHQRRIPDG